LSLAIPQLYDYLAQLCELNLIEIYNSNHKIFATDFRRKFDPYTSSIYISPQAETIESLFGVHLSKEEVLSIFGDHPASSNNWPEVFVLMPFVEEMKPIFDDHIFKVCQRLHLSVKRADDFFGTRAIVNDIWSAIVFSRFVIADLTGKNGNVFYELGMAHAIGKDAIIISQNTDDVPFDLQHLRIIVYNYTPPGMQEFERKLACTLEAGQVTAGQIALGSA
jgi:hypothetical protein